MLPEVTQFEDVVKLVSDTGIQFMDFAFRQDQITSPNGAFTLIDGDVLCRLQVHTDESYFYEIDHEKRQQAEPDFWLPISKSLALLDGVWLPLPFFRYMPPYTFDQGPSNWARMRFVKLAEPDIDGNTYRLTLALDTRVIRKKEGMAYMAPNDEDVSSGVSFRVASKLAQMRWFQDLPWVKDWLLEAFRDASIRVDRDLLQDQEDEKHPQAHYLNLLSLLERVEQFGPNPAQPVIVMPELVVIANGEKSQNKPIPVDLILDVGNSRTCGILIENQGVDRMGLNNNYVLELRDLLAPEHVYNQPFESRVEFSKTSFGKDHCSSKSGRHDAFQWPTIARVGNEAGRLASLRRGTEGSTGLSSPKRYLWDENAYEHGWRFSNTYIKNDSEAPATAAPFSHLINNLGEALYSLPEDDQMPVFKALYSRSSLMTFMLAEVLTQALGQINSPAQRSRQGRTGIPRQLNSITLTVPPGMPQAERSILGKRMSQAIGLVWKSMGWHNSDEDPYTDQTEPPTTPLPLINIDWDEASCGQLVYLYTEIAENFAGHPEEFFATLARPDKVDRDRITVASIDIGGGTTDLVITEYRIDPGALAVHGMNVHIVPKQLFRDSFKIAGDDILLDMIHRIVLPSLERGFREAKVESPDSLLSRLCGSETIGTQNEVLRQQLNLQVLTPLGLALLKAYEQFDPLAPAAPVTYTYRQLLTESDINPSVLNYVSGAVRRDTGGEVFDLLDTKITFDLPTLHGMFLNNGVNIVKPLSALCEVIGHYPCDVLLLTGRPSRLPGVQAFIRQNLPLVPGRIVPMQSYRTGGWYPFHKNGLIDDPKSTAAVGAMLCLLCANHSVHGFYLRADKLVPYSTIKHIGVIDLDNSIRDRGVLFRDIRTERGCIQLAGDSEEEQAVTPALAMPSAIRLGFRQLSVERWAASPLYSLSFTEEGKRKMATGTRDGSSAVASVRFKVAKNPETANAGLVSDQLEVRSVTSNTAERLDKNDVHLQFNTLLVSKLGDNTYWLDSGTVKHS